MCRTHFSDRLEANLENINKYYFIFIRYSTSAQQGPLVKEMLDLSDGNEENHHDEPTRNQVNFLVLSIRILIHVENNKRN